MGGDRGRVFGGMSVFVYFYKYFNNILKKDGILVGVENLSKYLYFFKIFVLFFK